MKTLEEDFWESRKAELLSSFETFKKNHPEHFVKKEEKKEMDIREKFIEMKIGAERALAKYPYMAVKEKEHHMLTAVLGKMVETGKLNVIFDAVNGGIINDESFNLTKDLVEMEAQEIKKKGLF